MIAKPTKSRFLPDLQMPLRDALRGVATLADATEDMLEPAARLLPEPIRSRFQNALQSIERAGKRLVHAPIDMSQIRAASRFFIAGEADRGTIDTGARVFAYAWEHLNEDGLSHRRLISETIVADRMSRTGHGSAAGGVDFAASVLADIRDSSAIGLLPGLTRGLSAEDAAETDIALLTIAVWLLAARAETLEEEEKLLDLSMALVRALKADAGHAFDDRDTLARFLADTSAHL